MKSISEEMRFRQRLCEYAMKQGVTSAAKRYHTELDYSQVNRHKFGNFLF